MPFLKAAFIGSAVSIVMIEKVLLGAIIVGLVFVVTIRRAE